MTKVDANREGDGNANDGIAARGRLVILRAKRTSDAEADYHWRTDPELAELDATAVLRLSFKDFRERYEEELRFPIPWVRRLAIDTFDGTHIGNCMVYDIDTVTGEGEIGIMIGAREFWARGYGRDALTLLLEYCFAMPSMRRIYLHTLEWNTRAQRAFAAVGFREVRKVKRAGKDFVLMDIRKPEWLELRGGLVTKVDAQTDA